MELGRALETALAAAREAGDLLRRDLERPDGARGGGDKAEADEEAEARIRVRLTEALPEWNYRGEETGEDRRTPGAPVWLVDPNDGTFGYLQGRRGSAVSIGVVVEGRPILGVVHAFAYPDGRGEMLAWAEGCGAPTRDGRPLDIRLPAALTASDVVALSAGAERRPGPNLACVAPARFRGMTSIAHRLGLVACGEAAAAVSVHSPGDWDYAGGHALVRAVGGELVGHDGRPVVYDAWGRSRTRLLFAGHADVARSLSRRDWSSVLRGRKVEGDMPARLAPGGCVRDADLLARAQGCLLGQIAGDNLGALVEFSRAEDVERARPGGPRLLHDGGYWNILAGQPTDDSELALALARSVLERGRYEAAAVLGAYRAWLRSGPFDVGATTRAGLEGRPSRSSEANGSLMRAAPLVLLAHRLDDGYAGELGRTDSALTHPHPVCGDAVGAFVVAGAALLRGEQPAEAYDRAVAWAVRADAAEPVRDALREAREAAPRCDGAHMGHVVLALQNAFFELLHASSLEEGVVATVRRGGDTDTNAAITGALLGAAWGRAGIPDQWRRMVLSCHPLAGHAHHARPREYWPCDALELAERLLLLAGA